jgi:outer membrane protein TolC
MPVSQKSHLRALYAAIVLGVALGALPSTTATVMAGVADVPVELESQASAAQASTDAYIQGLIDSLSSRAASPVSISLRDAVATAIGNNPGNRAERRIPESEQYGVIDAASAFEPVIAIDASYTKSKLATADALAGVTEVDADGNPVLQDPSDQIREDDRYQADFSIRKMFRTGTRIGLRWKNARATSNSRFEELSPKFEPVVGVRLQQPLLRDFGAVTANTNVRIAEETSRQAAAEFEEKLSDFVADVVSAYWDYVLAEAELRVARHALRLASELATETRKRVDVGNLPPVSAQEALADAAAREEKVIAAEQAMSAAARKLQYLVMYSDHPGGVPRALVPADDHNVADEMVDKSESLKTAVERRAEVRSARIDVKTSMLEERSARTNLLPSLDLVGRYELVGLGGVNENRMPDEYDALGNSFDVLTTGDFFRYSLGVEFEVPLSNAAARARHTRSEIDKRRREESLQQTIADVALEVDESAGDLASAYKRVAAANLSRELAQENLRHQQHRYEVGKVTTTDVLDFQEKLSDAMATEARAITDHAKAGAELLRAEGTLLDHFGIRVSFDDAPQVPWWAKF